jgi:hypothetical protein
LQGRDPGYTHGPRSTFFSVPLVKARAGAQRFGHRLFYFTGKRGVRRDAGDEKLQLRSAADHRLACDSKSRDRPQTRSETIHLDDKTDGNPDSSFCRDTGSRRRCTRQAWIAAEPRRSALVQLRGRLGGSLRLWNHRECARLRFRAAARAVWRIFLGCRASDVMGVLSPAAFGFDDDWRSVDSGRWHRPRNFRLVNLR